jgi:hypothetical protein
MGGQPKRNEVLVPPGFRCEDVSHLNSIHIITAHEKEFRFTISTVYTDQVSKIRSTVS